MKHAKAWLVEKKKNVKDHLIPLLSDVQQPISRYNIPSF